MGMDLFVLAQQGFPTPMGGATLAHYLLVSTIMFAIGLIGFRTERGDLWELMAAGGVLITAPMFLISLLVQKQFVGSLTAGSVR